MVSVLEEPNTHAVTFDGTTDSFFSYVQVLQEHNSVDFIWDAATYYIHYVKKKTKLNALNCSMTLLLLTSIPLKNKHAPFG